MSRVQKLEASLSEIGRLASYSYSDDIEKLPARLRLIDHRVVLTLVTSNKVVNGVLKDIADDPIVKLGQGEYERRVYE